ncbi:MAG: 4Fe-4S dicluster domain-containing protein [Coriobacteriaceae bacterium]|nr:4Fe-4S dicluster domain-containing protein [Coriobacteriaceae bacterium]
MKRVYSLEDRCLNCRLCEVACKTAHSATGDTFKAYKWEEPEPSARVHVEGTNKASIAVNCRHCAEPNCVEGCIAGAMKKDPETGIVTCDKDKCVGCRTCMAMCPFGAVRVEEYALKCDLCTTGYGDGDPACVRACINQALIFVESDEAELLAVERSGE